MAINGDDRPSLQSPDPSKKSLGGCLSNYTNNKSNIYDEEFNKEIRKLRPDWFKKNIILQY